MQRTTVVIALALGFAACNGDCGAAKQTKAPVKAPPARSAEQKAADEAAALLEPPDDVAAPPEDAERSASGLASKRLKPGESGPRARPFDLVRVHYTAWSTDGTLFDSTRSRGAPAEVPLEQAIAGWIEGIPQMDVGESRRFWIPGKLAYEGRKGFPQGMLVFDLELVGVEARPAPPPPPAELTKPPARASKSKSGLTSLVLQKGHGKEHPGPSDIVTVHYSGWNDGGELVDSSVKRGAPSTFVLNKVIAGWVEGIGQMVAGEKLRLWVPPGLGYLGREGPQGPLVYDIELLAIRKMPVAAAPAPDKKTASDEDEPERLEP